MSRDIPDAAIAAIAAVIEDNPFAPPRRQAELAVEELRRLGFRMDVPGLRLPTTNAAQASCSGAPVSQSVPSVVGR